MGWTGQMHSPLGKRMAVVLLLLLIGVLLFFTVPVLADDLCAFDSILDDGRNAVHVSALRTCVNSVPFNATIRNETVEVLIDMLQQYTFTDIARNSGAPYNIMVDMVAELNNIRSRTYSSDFSFHLDVATLFNRLHDAHTIYFAPAPYQKCVVIFPFLLESFLDETDGTQKVRILKKTISNNAYTEWSKISLDPYIGKTLYKIDGVNAMQYLTNFSNSLYISKDPSVRFNQAIKQDFSIQVLANSPLPADDNVFLDFGPPLNTIALPWMGGAVRKFSGIEDFRSEIVTSRGPSLFEDARKYDTRPFNQRPMISARMDLSRDILKALDEPASGDSHRSKLSPRQSPKSNPFNPTIAMPFELTRRVMEKLTQSGESSSQHTDQLPMSPPPKPFSSEDIHRMQQLDSVEAPSTMGMQLIAVTDMHDAMFFVYDNEIAILKFTTFMPSSFPLGIPSITDSEKLFQLIAAHSKQHNISRLMIDVVGNGGGFVCLAYGMMSFFVPEWSDSSTRMQTYGPYDMRHSPLYDELVTSQFFAPQQQINPATHQVYTDNSWYTPGRNFTRGGAVSEYSPLWNINCNNQNNGKFWVQNTENYFFDDIAIVTDGTCGSACSLFASQMQHKKKAKLISVGGLSPSMETSSFAGGAVLQYSAFVEAISSETVSNKPKPLPTTSYAGFNFIEYYLDDDENVPREFKRLTSDHHLYFWNFANLDRLYAKIMPVFDGVDISTITHANGTNDCPSHCSGHGFCANSKCYCYGRFTGPTCSGSYPFEPNWDLYQAEEIPFPTIDFTPLIIAVIAIGLVMLVGCCGCLLCILLIIVLSIFACVLISRRKKSQTREVPERYSQLPNVNTGATESLFSNQPSTDFSSL